MTLGDVFLFARMMKRQELPSVAFLPENGLYRLSKEILSPIGLGPMQRRKLHEFRSGSRASHVTVPRDFESPVDIGVR
jgi:hypothetical protein